MRWEANTYKYIFRGFLLATVLLFAYGSLHVYAQATQSWNMSYSIRDQTDNRDLQKDEPLIAGHSYTITMTIQVPQTQPGGTFMLSLNSRMKMVGTQVWNILGQYGGFDPAISNPASYQIGFKQVQGSLQISVTFAVPQDYAVVNILGSVVIRQPREDVIITVFIPGGSVVGAVKLRVIDASIQTYEKLYNDKKNLIATGAIDRAYEPFINSLLNLASSLAGQGLYDQASDLLRSIDPSKIPQPPSSIPLLGLIGGVVALAAVAAVLFIMMSRARVSRDEALAKIRDARNRVAGIKVRAQKFDKVLAQEIEELEKILGE